MSDQDDHDYRMAQNKDSLKGSRSKLEALLKVKKQDLQAQSRPELLDPIEAAVKNNPGLTREKAEEIATKLGF